MQETFIDSLRRTQLANAGLHEEARQWWKTSWTGYIILLGLLVGLVCVIFPSSFFFRTAPLHLASVSTDALRFEKIEHDLSSLKQQLKQTGTTVAAVLLTERQAELYALRFAETDIKAQRKRMPWFGSASPQEQMTLDRSVAHHAAIDRDIHALQELRESVMSDQRAVTAVWSKLCFDEIRDVWWARNKVHADMSWTLWRYDIIFDALFGPQRDSLLTIVVQTVGHLLFRLTFGAVITLMDFAIRIPFYLREYDQYDFDEELARTRVEEVRSLNIDTHPNAEHISVSEEHRRTSADHPVDAPDTLNHDEHTLATVGSRQATTGTGLTYTPSDSEAILGRVERPSQQNGWLSWRSLSLTSAYLVMLSGALLAALISISVIWSPVCVLCCCIVRHNRNRVHPHEE